jgi:hypothetical protein
MHDEKINIICSWLHWTAVLYRSSGTVEWCSWTSNSENLLPNSDSCPDRSQANTGCSMSWHKQCSRGHIQVQGRHIRCWLDSKYLHIWCIDRWYRIKHRLHRSNSKPSPSDSSPASIDSSCCCNHTVDSSRQDKCIDYWSTYKDRCRECTICLLDCSSGN